MNYDLLSKLSNADSIASYEDEVRDILYSELKEYCDDIYCDSLGSVIFYKKGKGKNPLKLMFCAHIDEVGFLVRHISDIGFLHLIKVGGVSDKSLEMQLVRVTTNDGKKIEGIMNVKKDDKGIVNDIYVDVGCNNSQEVSELGIEIGNMVCFASQFKKLSNSNIYAGKAMDDRSGCYAIVEALKSINDSDNDLYFVGTSSEEVGIRGGKTATALIDPDLVFAIDVANNPELVKNYTNHRILGKGPMIVHFDKTMVPNRKLLDYVKKLAKSNGIPYQSDMFSGGGTDAGNAHLELGGRLALVLGIPLRYCHGSYSLVHDEDLNCMIKLIRCLSSIKHDEFISMKNFLGGKK